MTHEEIDYKLAAEQLRTGQPLFGKYYCPIKLLINKKKLGLNLTCKIQSFLVIFDSHI